MTTRHGDHEKAPISSEKLLKETEKLHERLLATVTELELFVTALSAQNMEQGRSLGEDPKQ